jgi:hypothetical protein
MLEGNFINDLILLLYLKKSKNIYIFILFLFSKSGINPHDFYNGHWGPITGLDFHPMAGPVDFSDLFLTSSVDWTVKLWKSKVSNKNLFIHI